MNATQNAISHAIAEALAAGTNVEAIAELTGLSKTEILNRADNVQSRTIETNGATKMQFDSQILANSFNFEGQKAGRSYLKAKDRAIKARGNEQAALIEEAKAARADFIALVPFMDASTFDDIVTEYCGLGREWNTTGKMVKEFAEANGIDQALAADLTSRQMAVAQDYAQSTRGLKFGRYVSWLQDAAAEADENNIPKNLEDILLQAYARAAQWNQPADGLLIRDFAERMGVSEILPSWADNLKANMPSAEQALEARKRMSNRAAAAAAAEQEAEQELTQTFGNF